MSGWMRLWVLLSAIWAAFVIGITTVIVADSFGDVDGPWIVYSLSDKAKPYFQNLESDEKGPAYTVEFSYTDGTKQNIRFPLLEDAALVDLDRKIKNLAKQEGKNVSEIEISRFLNVVSRSNSEAKSALNEYQREIENGVARKANDRKQTFGVAALVLVVPLIILLLLGYGIAWVRKGFA